MFILKRSAHNPIITPFIDHPWESQATFNCSPICRGSMTHLLYRAMSRPDVLGGNASISTIGSAVSLDGIHFQGHRPFITPSEEWDKFGCEDPRAVEFEGKYVICYTALSEFPFRASGIKVGMAISKDLERVDEKHLVTPFNAKAMTLFPERINGKVTAILTAHTDEPPSTIAIASAPELKDFWREKFWEKWHADLPKQAIDSPLRTNRDHIEVGAPPIKTKEGWLLIYSYIQNYFGGGQRVFGIEALLLDLKDPRKIVGKTGGPIIVPEEIYERYGLVPNVVFPSGATLSKNGRLDIYYGAADTVCAKASVDLNDLLSSMIEKRRIELVVRAKENPIIKPIKEHSWESRATFNAASLDLGGKIHIVYRAMSEDNTSVFGYAATKDGVHITERLDKPIYVPRESFEMKQGSPTGNSGCEDPRLTKIGPTVYMTYTAFDGVHPTLVALSSISAKDFTAKRFEKFTKPFLITPPNVNEKDVALLPEKVNGQFMLLHRAGVQVCADFVDSVELGKGKHVVDRCVEIMAPRPGKWDSEKIGIAGPPVKTKSGWLLIYHGVSYTGTYRLGAVLLDLKNPTAVLSRTVDPIFEPIEQYEKEGQVRKVVFSCGIVRRNDTLFIYYGGGDSVLGVAKVSVRKLLELLLPRNLKDV